VAHRQLTLFLTDNLHNIRGDYLDGAPCSRVCRA
jgi:hypothetical protein